jgi:hypothetical protein
MPRGGRLKSPKKKRGGTRVRMRKTSFFVLEYVGCRDKGVTVYKDHALSRRGRDVTTSTKIRITFLKQRVDTETEQLLPNEFDVIPVTEEGVLRGDAVPVIINSQKTMKVKINPSWFNERWGSNKVYVVL